MNRTLRWFFLMSFLGVALTSAPRLAAAVPARTAVHPAPSSFVQPALLAVEPAANESSGRERLFDWINFTLLVAVLVYVLRKPLAQFFTQRSSALEHGLEEGRRALEAARAQLAEAEAKMGRLEQDIAAFKAAALRERDAERERFSRAGDAEAQRILESARAMIESATQAAKLELRSAAASQAVTLAEAMIRERLDEAGRARLVSQFLQGIETDPGTRQHN